VRFYPKSSGILNRNRKYLTGGVASLNRTVEPEIVFVQAEGAYMWDADGNRYIDYHAAFAPHLLGHNDPSVIQAVERVLRDRASLYGSGTTILEGRHAQLVCEAVPFVESVQFLNTGSEATYQAIRLTSAVTARDHVIVMQGAYNGWHNDVSCNLMTPFAAKIRKYQFKVGQLPGRPLIIPAIWATVIAA
jgi:glutamate-1-semialdehyde 2,1-aminomutase